MEDEITGRARGGFARAAKLTPEERRAIAQKGAKERWEGTALPKATHQGELNLAGYKVSCAVLEDGTRVLVERSMATALGKKGSGRHWEKKKEGDEKSANLPEYVSAHYLSKFMTDELRQKLETPIIYIPLRGQRSKTFKGVNATLLADICDLWITAKEKGALNEKQIETANRAYVLMKAFANVGIVALIDEATGYQEIRPKDALQAYLEMIVSKDLAAWSKKFPDEFYENIYKLKGWVWPGMSKNRYSVVAKYTNDLVYERIAIGLLEELKIKSPKDDKGQRKHKLHQWLTEDIGNPLLAQHLHSLIMFQRLAMGNGYGWVKFKRMVDQVLPRRGSNMELPLNYDDLALPSGS